MVGCNPKRYHKPAARGFLGCSPSTHEQIKADGYLLAKWTRGRGVVEGLSYHDCILCNGTLAVKVPPGFVERAVSRFAS